MIHLQDISEDTLGVIASVGDIIGITDIIGGIQFDLFLGTSSDHWTTLTHWGDQALDIIQYGIIGVTRRYRLGVTRCY
jgi:hypothetical protein